MDDNEVF